MKLLLDTCVLLWMVGEPSRISTRARQELTRDDAELVVSAISAFEISIKYRKGKLSLPLPPRPWFREALSNYGVAEIPITSEIAGLAPEVDIPQADPCDRMIVATAQLLDIPLLTSDQSLLDARDLRVIW
jgi:PIN domain nuclease of toxin-antitoxin system